MKSKDERKNHHRKRKVEQKIFNKALNKLSEV